MKPEIVRQTIQTVYSMGLREFELLFGESMGGHLWDKFTEGKRDVGLFICRLDDNNLKLLVENAVSGNPIIDRYL